MRRNLGLPAGQPILEAIESGPIHLRAEMHERLAAWEHDVARRSQPSPGARALLETLRRRGGRLGILTRNSRANAWVTLEAVGLSDLFEPGDVLGRDEATPKPSPDGILAHLKRWRSLPEDAIMVGDFEFDLRAGRDAGVATVYIDPAGAFPHRDWADISVQRLDELI